MNIFFEFLPNYSVLLRQAEPFIGSNLGPTNDIKPVRAHTVVSPPNVCTLALSLKVNGKQSVVWLSRLGFLPSPKRGALIDAFPSSYACVPYSKIDYSLSPPPKKSKNMVVPGLVLSLVSYYSKIVVILNVPSKNPSLGALLRSGLPTGVPGKC